MAKDKSDNLPDVETLKSLFDESPELAPPLIDGVLRQGHKMLLAGPSKAGKSYALIELCISIAEGQPWLGFPCTQGRVMYVNLELDRASCLHRFRDVYEVPGWLPKHIDCIDVWNLRGRSVPMDKLAPKLICRAKNREYKAITVDPIYKVLTGNENSALDMGKFCNYFEQVATETDSSIIYCHHHSKGDQSWKRSADRASGSGVFARDVDALLDVTELELPPERRKRGVTAWRVTGTLREFKAFDPVDIWFNYPLHIVEHFDSKEVAPHHELPAWRRAMNARSSKEDKLRKRKHRLLAAYDVCSADGKIPTVKVLADYLGVSGQTIRNMVDEHPGLSRISGKVVKVPPTG